MNLPKNNTVIHTKRIRPRLKPIQGAPDLLPFVNLFFLLLFFFVISSSFVQVSGIPVNLPVVSSVSNSSVKKYVITLDQDNRIYFNDTVMVDLVQLRGKLNSDISDGSKDNRNAIVLRVDRASSFETVSKIMAIAEELNLDMFILARKSDSGKTVFTELEKR